MDQQTRRHSGMSVKTIALVALCAVIATSAGAFPAGTRADTSKLATGRWVKIKVSGNGMYQITASDAKKWGLGDLSKVHVFGFGGGAMSEQLTSDIPDDLPQVPVVRTGSKLLFYGQGNIKWKAQSGAVNYVQEQNPYATAGYYFVTDDSRYSDVAIAKSSASLGSGKVINTVTGREFHEEELVNPGETGRQLLGEDFRYTTTQPFKFTLDGLTDGGTVNVLTNFAAKTYATGNVTTGATVTAQYNGTRATNSLNINTVTDVAHEHYKYGTFVNSFTLSGTTSLTYTLSFSPIYTLYMARLNYITVNYQRNLALSGGTIGWGQYSGDVSDQFQLSGGNAGTHVWDVTVSHQPIEMNTSLSGSTVTFSPAQSGNREYVAFDQDATFPTPSMVGTVKNQNIHGEATPDMIIISPSAYLAQARRVAALHESVDSMRVLVVDQNDVFNEFSSGTPDAMAYRMLAKCFYDRGTDSQGHKLGYLLLFGGGSYDNRQLTNSVQAISYPMLLTWQTELSDNETASFTSDDPFAILADNSGSPFQYNDLSIAIGRMPVRNVSEARLAVDKLVKYVTTPDNGAWKTNVLDVADDEDYGIHMKQAETTIVNEKKNGGADMIYNKVYTDAFTALSSGGGRTYPDARTKMYRLLDEGVAWWNYTGHGSPNVLTGEGIITTTDLTTNFYYKHQPIFYAATCEFARFDAIAKSGGEKLLLTTGGGVIAIVCPPRLVYEDNNGRLHSHVANYTFAKDADGLPLRLGDIMRLGKNAYRQATASGGDRNNLPYFLLGDPAMRPAIPTYKIQVESINGQQVNENNMPVFQARQLLTFAGKVTDAKGRDTDFNGPVIATLYDSEQSVETHGYGQNGEKYVYLDRPNKLAVKVDTVRNGRFEFKLTVPSEIMATYDNYSPSLISLYAYDNTKLNSKAYNGGSIEAQGSNIDFYIYGYDDSVVTDTIGPSIDYLGLNSENFKDGDEVNESPLVIASIADESGINLSTSGIGHSITLTLDDNTTLDDVTSYFTPAAASNGNGTAGTISYQLSNLANGNHTLKLKAWDVFNNSAEKTITFFVESGLKPDIYDVYSDANPASVEANFYVKHNRPDATLTVTIDIYNLLGRKIWSSTETGRSNMFTTFPITWNLTDYGGARVPRGIYIYKATVTTNGEQEATKAKKIAVTAQ